MTTYYAVGSPTHELQAEDLIAGLQAALEARQPQRVLAVPPDATRIHSQAGRLTCLAHRLLGDRLRDVMPALGTHVPMTPAELARMFPTLPSELIRVHRWRDDVLTLGEVPGDFVSSATNGVWRQPWPAQLNRLAVEGGHDLILSLGQIVPHEVIGMAGHNKNLFVGIGGAAGINASHYLSAACGMEQAMGRADTPLRRILNEAERQFLQSPPVVYVLTVIGRTADHREVIRGLFVGEGAECFERAAALAAEVNIETLAEAPQKMVVWLDPAEFKTTWLGNKAIYRTRMAIADGGELVVLAPGVHGFGEDPEIDRLIRSYGYRPSAEVQRLVEANPDLRANLSAAAHLIHGSSEGRFRITYCPGGLTRAEVESVGYAYADLPEMLDLYAPSELTTGWNSREGDRFYYIDRPGLGLWRADASRGGL